MTFERSSGRLFATVLVLIIAPLDFARAGFFDFLFAPSAPDQRMSPPPFQVPRLAHKHRFHVGDLRKADPNSPAKTVDVMNDMTLQRGDAVMTPNGIRIFTGSSSKEPRPRDFAKLSEVRGLGPHERTALAAIDAHRSDGGWQPPGQLVTGRSQSALVVDRRKVTLDPNGRQIRVVGP